MLTRHQKQSTELDLDLGMQFKKLHFHLLMHMICHLHYRAPKINSVKFNALTKIQEKRIYVCDA